MAQEIKLLFCSSFIIPVICSFRDTTPKVCCCTCPLKWECHKKQKEIAEANKDYSNILPCVRLDDDDEEDYCKNCDFLT